MVLSIIAVLVGLGLLIWSADRFVEGASATANQLGVSTLIIGITIIGFGTSAPEILISIFASLDNTPDLAIGNALGSNIANIALILGVTALLVPLPIASKLLKKEFPVLLGVTAFVAYCLMDAKLSFIEGILLLVILFASLLYFIKSSKQDDILNQEFADEIPQDMTLNQAIIWLFIGLIALVFSSKILVWGAVNIATYLGVPDLIIGLTIVALGTSLPELAAAIASAKKGEPDLAIGNVIGSNLFNSLAVIAIPSLLTTFTINSIAITRDLPVMIGLTILLYLLAKFPSGQDSIITRGKGILLLSCFVGYQFVLYFQTIALIA